MWSTCWLEQRSEQINDTTNEVQMKRDYFYQLPSGICDLADRVHFNRQLRASPPLFLKKFRCNIKTWERFLTLEVCSPVSGNSCSLKHTKLTTDAEFCTLIVLKHAHTQTRKNLTIWPINLHSRQLETLLWHPFGWVLPKLETNQT